MPNENAALNPLALEALINNQRQLDIDGVEVGVSRQALDELIAAYTAVYASPLDAERHERAVPDGWQLVPKAMDVKMIGAWYRYKNGWHSHDEPTPRDTSDAGAWAALLSAAPSPPAAEQDPVAVKAEDIEVIEEVVGGYDWLGTGSSYDHAGKREAEQAWLRIRSALSSSSSTSKSDPAPEIAALRAENERLRMALEPFVNIARNDIGYDEDDTDFFQPMTANNRVPRLIVGHFRFASDVFSLTPEQGAAK